MNADTELFLKMRRGDMKSFDILVERYMKKAYYFAYGYVGNEETAKDLSQDAFVKIYKERQKFNPDYNFGTWFFTVLRNICLNYVKRRNLHLSLRLQNTGKYENNIDDKIDISEAMIKLNDRERELIKLKYFDGFSYEEIAELIDIPIGSVMSGLFYAKKHMKKIIEEL